MSQLAIDFDRPTSRSSDPETSREAAVIALDRAETHRELALAALRTAGPRGLNDFELGERTNVGQTSIGRRRLELQDAGLVAPRMVPGKHGPRQDRRNDCVPSGARSAVWVAIEFHNGHEVGDHG